MTGADEGGDDVSSGRAFPPADPPFRAANPYDLALRSYAAGHLEAAESVCRGIVAAVPDYVPARHLMGLILQCAGRTDEALRHLRRAAALDAGNSRIAGDLGAALLSAGKVDEARTALEHAVAIRPAGGEAQSNLSAVLARTGDRGENTLVSVITPSVGTPYLRRAIRSVEAQSHRAVEHWIVADGPAAEAAVRAAVAEVGPTVETHVLSLPFNTGADGYNGHRIYAAIIHLVRGRYVAFLDEDNWFDPDHLASLLAVAVGGGLPWTYSLRKVWDCEGRFIAEDNCDSLGHWETWYAPGRHLVDTSCYLLRLDVAMETSVIWQRRVLDDVSPDFWLAHELLRRYPQGVGTLRHTLNYLVGRSPNSASAEFILDGNRAMLQRYPDGLPWKLAAASRRRRAEPINIAVACDAPYVRFLCVMLHSLLDNNPGRRVRVFVLTTAPAEIVAAIDASVAGRGCEIVGVVLNEEMFAGAPVGHHISLASYFRLIVGEALPPDIDRVLYLDADTLVVGSLSELWECDLRGNILGAVAEESTWPSARLGLPEEAGYFNAGVLLVDLGRWREEEIGWRTLEFALSRGERLTWYDQCALNAVVAGRWLRLDRKWNLQTLAISDLVEHEAVYDPARLGRLSDAAIVHFTTQSKPWHAANRHPMKALYERYAADTPWPGHPSAEAHEARL